MEPSIIPGCPDFMTMQICPANDPKVSATRCRVQHHTGIHTFMTTQLPAARAGPSFYAATVIVIIINYC